MVERETAQLSNYIEKLDASVEKLTAISADVTQLLAVHENRLTFQERMHNQLELKVDKRAEAIDDRFGKIYDRIDELRTDIKEEIETSRNDVLKKIGENTTKISTLEKWMWTCLGGGSVLMLALDKIGPAVGL
jgi:hypothetical protein